MLTVSRKAPEKPEKGERRDKTRISIIHIAKKTGVILSNGELWNGTERREKRGKNVEMVEKPKEDKDVKKGDPTNFFG